jgi:hypothetical protein
MFSFFQPKVTEKIYKNYVDTGNVPSKIITLLALKTIKGEELNQMEFAIFCNKTTEINEEIKTLTLN